MGIYVNRIGDNQITSITNNNGRARSGTSQGHAHCQWDCSESRDHGLLSSRFTSPRLQIHALGGLLHKYSSSPTPPHQQGAAERHMPAAFPGIPGAHPPCQLRAGQPSYQVWPERGTGKNLLRSPASALPLNNCLQTLLGPSIHSLMCSNAKCLFSANFGSFCPTRWGPGATGKTNSGFWSVHLQWGGGGIDHKPINTWGGAKRQWVQR